MPKLSRREAGYLGAIKSKEVITAAKNLRIAKYSLNPKKCKHCDNYISYEKRKLIFCDSTCSATHNNLARGKKLTEWQCLNCQKKHSNYEWHTGKYCDSKCQHEYQSKLIIDDWLNGGAKSKWKYSIPSWAKRYLAEQRGYACEECGITEHNSKPIVLECDHIDGNSTNNLPENLRLICPNCHSQTPNFKGANRGNGRKYRY